MTASDERRRAAAGGPTALVAAAALLAYGAEIFSFNLSMDEPVFAGAGPDIIRVFVGQGRWALALSNLVLPEAVAPVVPTALGVALIAAALWWLARRSLDLPPWPAAFATSLALTLPPLAFHLSFSLNAVGLGVGFVATAIFATQLDRGGRYGVLLASLAGAWAIGTYESFGIALLAVVALLSGRGPLPGDKASLRWLRTGAGLGLIVIAAVVSSVAAFAARALLGIARDGYVDDFLDAGDPSLGARIGAAVGQLFDVMSLRSEGVASLWPGLIWLVLVVAALATVVRARDVLRSLALLALPLVALSGGLVVGEVPERVLVYLPIVFLALFGLAWPTLRALYAAEPSRLRRALAVAAMGLAVAAILAQATTVNLVLHASRISLSHDTYVAWRIDEEIRRLVPDPEGPVPVVISRHDWWGSSSLAPTREHLGISLFHGESWRGVAYLRSLGIDVVEPSPEQRLAVDTAPGARPAYPQDGWVRVVGDVVVVNLGDPGGEVESGVPAPREPTKQ